MLVLGGSEEIRELIVELFGSFFEATVDHGKMQHDKHREENLLHIALVLIKLPINHLHEKLKGLAVVVLARSVQNACVLTHSLQDLLVRVHVCLQKLHRILRNIVALFERKDLRGAADLAVHLGKEAGLDETIPNR